MLGLNAVYYYAVYLVLSALVRDGVVHRALEADEGSVRANNDLDRV